MYGIGKVETGSKVLAKINEGERRSEVLKMQLSARYIYRMPVWVVTSRASDQHHTTTVGRAALYTIHHMGVDEWPGAVKTRVLHHRVVLIQVFATITDEKHLDPERGFRA